MGRFAPRYSTEQRAAIYKAVLDQHMSHNAAIVAAADGRLGIQPFAITRSSVGYLCREERRRRDSAAYRTARAKGIGVEVEEYRDRLLHVADRLTATLVRKGAKAPPDQAIRAARLLQEITRIDPHNTNARPTKGRAENGMTNPAATSSDWLDTLAQTAADERPPSTNPPQHQTAHRDNQTRDASATTTPTTTSSTTDNSPVSRRERVIAARRAAGLG